jgi:hypothetical protein
MTRQSRFLMVLGGCLLAAAAVAAWQQLPPDAAVLQGVDAPPNAVFVDSLDLSPVSATVIRRQGRGGRGGAATATPPPAPVYTLGGQAYPHALPMNVDRDLSIDLKASTRPCRQAAAA